MENRENWPKLLITDNDRDLVAIILKYGGREVLTSEEQAILDEWCSRSAQHAALAERFRDPEWLREQLTVLNNVPSAEIWERISREIREKTTKRVWWWPWNRRRKERSGPLS